MLLGLESLMAINVNPKVQKARLRINHVLNILPAKITAASLSSPTPGKGSILSIVLKSASKIFALRSSFNGSISLALS